MDETIRSKTTFEFLEKDVYLPGYMFLDKVDYDRNRGIFDFKNVKEPSVTRGPLATYLTPRGLHILISQATYALAEEMIYEDRLEELNIETLRELALQGRIKITELYQKFRREIGLSKQIQGKVDLTKLRHGKMPIFKFDFDFGNKAIHGNLVAVIARSPTAQLNQYILKK